MMKPVCVIIPCYNSMDTIIRLLRSLQIQTSKCFDTYLAIDGDSHLEDYKGLKDHFDIHVMYFKENMGAGMTRQRCLDKIKSKYQYVMFADSDDMLNPRALEILYKAIITTRSDIAYSSIIRQLEDNSSYMIDVNNKEHKAISWCVGKLYNIDFLKKKRIRFRKELRLNEDIYFNYMCFNLTDKVVRVSEVTYLWLYNKNSTTTKDKSLDYIIYNIEQSLLSSTYSILDLAKKNKNRLDEKILATKLINIYSISQEALHYNINMNQFKYIYDMLSNEVDVYEFVKNNVEFYVDRLQQISISNNFKYYYFKQSFIEFIKEAYNNKKGGN